MRQKTGKSFLLKTVLHTNTTKEKAPHSEAPRIVFSNLSTFPARWYIFS